MPDRIHPSISVIMATHNGEPTLPLTFDAFLRLEMPTGGVEFIAVDNASTDRTPEILSSYQSRLPLKILSEPKPGKSRALNLAIPHATGEIVVFTDDDVLPDPNWLIAFSTAALEVLDADIFSGQVRHHWQKPPPEWLKQLAADGRSYAGTRIDRPRGPVELGEIKGLNFMVRRHVLSTLRFREELGYGADGKMLPGEETEFARRAENAGHRLYYVPEARLEHIVRVHQVGILPVVRRYFLIGRAIEAINYNASDQSIPTVFGWPRYLLRTLPKESFLAVMQFAFVNRYKGALQLINLARKCGRAYEWRCARRR